MAGDGFQVHPETLAAHAGQVQRVADGLATAKGAADTVRMGNEAYGKVCTIVPIMITALQYVLVGGFDEAVQALHDGAERLRATADAYKRFEESTQQDFARYGARL